ILHSAGEDQLLAFADQLLHTYRDDLPVFRLVGAGFHVDAGGVVEALHGQIQLGSGVEHLLAVPIDGADNGVNETSFSAVEERGLPSFMNNFGFRLLREDGSRWHDSQEQTECQYSEVSKRKTLPDMLHKPVLN